MLDSGSSISLIQESIATAFSRPTEAAPNGHQLVSAAEKQFQYIGLYRPA